MRQEIEQQPSSEPEAPAAELSSSPDAAGCDSEDLTIISASYGRGHNRADVLDRLVFIQYLGRAGGQLTEAVAGEGFLLLTGGPLSYNRLFMVDPCPGAKKTLRVEYAKLGMKFAIEIIEDSEAQIGAILSQDHAEQEGQIPRNS